MTSDEKYIIKLIIAHEENEQVDFKKNFTQKKKSLTLLKILFLFLTI